MARHVLRLGYMCLNICQHIGGSILATTHYPKSHLIFILYVISIWTFSWYFEISSHYHHHQQPDLTPYVNRSMSLAPDVYIYLLYEPPDNAQEPLMHHHFNACNNFYRGFTHLNNRLTICR